MKYQPKKYRLLADIDEVFITDNGLVITGCPEEDDENHDCDYAGCGSLGHVVYRYNEPQCSVEEVVE